MITENPQASNTFLIKWKTINDRFLKPVIVKKRRKVELFTHVKGQVFIRCRIWRHGLREVISKHKHAVRHFWAILLPAAPVIEVAIAVCSKSLISPISHSFSIMLSLLDQSIPRDARKNSTNIMHPQMLPNLYWMALYISNVFGHILKQFLPCRIQYDFLENLRCYSDSMLGQLHMYIRDIGSFSVP